MTDPERGSYREHVERTKRELVPEIAGMDAAYKSLLHSMPDIARTDLDFEKIHGVGQSALALVRLGVQMGTNVERDGFPSQDSAVLDRITDPFLKEAIFTTQAFLRMLHTKGIEVVLHYQNNLLKFLWIEL
jgi:hypothetical protein